MHGQLRKFRIPLLVALIVSLGLGLGLGWKLRRDRAAQLGVVTSSKKIRVLALSGALPPQILRGFRSTENIEVELTTEPTPEALYAHLDRDPSFDLVTLLVSQTSRAIQNMKIQPFKTEEIAGFENVSRDFVELPEKLPTTVPFLWGLLGFVYDTKTVKPVKTWADVFDLPRETKIALKPLDFEIQRLAKLGLPQPLAENALQDRVRKFNSIYKKTETFLASSEAKEAEGDVVEVSFSEGTLDAYKDMDFVLPNDGALMWILSFALGADAVNLEEAKAFVSYVLNPEVAIEISHLNHEASTNKGVESSGLLPTQKPSSLRRIPLTILDLQFNDSKN
jgi:spermidine/putrescine transport system substrate-binding protein